MYKNARQRQQYRDQELCESLGGRPGPPVPNSPNGTCAQRERERETERQTETETETESLARSTILWLDNVPFLRF